MSEPKYSKRTKQGHYVISTWWSNGGYYGPVDALVLRDLERGPEFVVALGYDTDSGVWGQGRYFVDLPDAIEYVRDRRGRLPRIEVPRGLEGILPQDALSVAGGR